MLDDILGIASSGGVGAALGLIGGVASKWMDLKKQKQDNINRLEMAKVRVAESKLEQQHELAMADKQAERAQIEAEIQADIMDGNALITSIQAASVSSGSVVVDGIKQLMRPIITTVLMMFSIWLAYSLWSKVGGLDSLTADQLVELFQHVINQLVFLTVTAVTWWFAARPARMNK
jgi:Fe2+ transport system protein B